MNLIFRIFLGIGAIVVVALFAALLAPYFIDWDEYTDQFEQEASRVAGQPVRVGGETKLRLLPLPSLAFRELEVGRNDDGTPMMTVEEFSVKAELFPFLRGEIRIVEMNMLRPDLNLQVDEGGKIAWTSPAQRLVNPEQVKIERLLIDEGRVTISGLTGGRNLELDQIGAEVSANSLIGPWRINATANVEGVASELGIQTGTLQEDGSIRLKIEASQKTRPYRLLVDGPVELRDEVLAWAGDFSLVPFSEQRVSEMETPSEPLPVVTDGRFDAAPDLIQIPEYRMEIGDQSDPYTITGAGSISVSENIFFRARADGRQIDLDRIREAENATGGNSLESRITALRRILDRIPVPGIDGEVNMVLPALVAGDTYIRDVSAVVQPFGESWNLRAFSAKFPGNTTMEASGRLGLGEDFGFDGNILLASRQPSGFASWISGDVDPAFRRLSRFGIAAGVSVSEKQASFNNMELRMDDAVLRGRMQRIASRDKLPAILLKLQGNRVNMEDLRAIYSLVQKPEEKDEVTHDLDIDITADTLEAVVAKQEISANGVDAQFRVRNGSVTVERFNAEAFYGAQITSSGRIENLLSRPNGNMRFTVETGNAAPLLQFAKRYLGEKRLLNNLLAETALTRDTRLELELDTTAQDDGARGQVLSTGRIGGTLVNLRLGFDGRLDAGADLPLTINGKFENPDPSILMRQMGIATAPLDLVGEVSGPMVAEIDMAGKSAESLRTQLSVQLPDTTLVASGELATPDWNSVQGRMEVTLGSDNLAPHLILADIRAPGLALDERMPASGTMTVERKQGITSFQEITGQLSGNRFSGALELQETEVARPRLKGIMRFDRLDLALLGESVFGRQSALLGNVANDLGIDSGETSFSDPYYGGHDADLKLEAETIHVGDLLEGQKASLSFVMLDGSVNVSDLTFVTMGGRFSGGFELKNTQGTVLANSRFAFSDINLQTLMNTVEMSDFARGKVSLQGTGEATGKSTSALVASLSGNGVAEITGLSLIGLNPDGFDDILLETGVDGYEIVSDEIRELVEETILTAGMQLDAVQTPFSITRGQVRARNVTAEASGTELLGNLEINLPEQTVDASLGLLFDPGRREAIKGVDPQLLVSWNGDFSAPGRTTDTDRLESYLSLRAFEQSQRRVETLEAKVIETQRLQQQIAMTFARENHLERRRKEEIERQDREETRRLENASRLFLENLERREDELAREREEAERKRQEEEARRKAEEQARLEAERKAREEAERLKAEQEAREAAARAEAERKAREEEERRAAEEAARLEEERKAEEAAAKEAAEREAREAAARQKAEQEARRKKAGQGESGNDDVPVEVQNLLQENIMRNLENFLNSN
jgi:hypothetical protein